MLAVPSIFFVTTAYTYSMCIFTVPKSHRFALFVQARHRLCDTGLEDRHIHDLRCILKNGSHNRYQPPRVHCERDQAKSSQANMQPGRK